MHLLIYNPNSDASLTDRLRFAVDATLSEGDKLDCATAHAGPSFIGSAETIEAARSYLAEAMLAAAPETDAVLLGCFGDLEIDYIRRSAGFPILSLSDACFAVAPLLGKRIAIITTTAFWADKLSAEVCRRGLSSAVVAVRPCLESAAATHLELIARCKAEAERIAMSGTAEVVVLGGALLAVFRAELIGSPIPILDLFGAAVETCRLLAIAR